MPRNKSRLLCVYPLLDAELLPALEALGEVVVTPTGSEAEIAERIVAADVLIARGPGRITAPHIASAKRLRAIISEGAGYDHIDVEAATRARVPVISGSGVGAGAVAEYVLGAMVVGHRRMRGLQETLLAGEVGEWTDRLPLIRGAELTDSVLGIVGYGNIGREIARRAIAAFGVRVVAFGSIAKIQADEEMGVERAETLGELLERSQTISINVPLTRKTMGLINQKEIELIGPDGVLIDTSRGGVVDVDALVAALAAGRLKGAVIDVLPEEPPSPELIRKLSAVPNLVVTPHVAGATNLAQRRLSAAAVEAARAAIAGDPLPRVVNVTEIG